MVWIVMGVSGSGKTTVGKLLADRLDLPFYDADDFHPDANIEKMSSGQPLNDLDRKPWLQILANNIAQWTKSGGAVLACSALKKKYRSTLTSKCTDVQFIYLNGSKEVILNRMKNRESHYMPPKLLDSQFKALEEPSDALNISIDSSPEEIVDKIVLTIDNAI